MISRKQLFAYCLLAFLVGGTVTGSAGYYWFKSVMEVFTHFEMIEDFAQGTAMVAHFQNGNPEFVYEFMVQSLESSCMLYLSPDFESSIDQEHARVLVLEAQEATGLCK
jgi:hypothetical protein